MIDNPSVRAVAGASFSNQFVKPLYDSYCFSRIPQLIQSAFGINGDPAVAAELLGPLAAPYDNVILCFIDGFGWRFFEQYAERYPFLRRIVQDGVVTKLTSQFPSTTSAHTTTIHTGLEVGQSGVYEWFYYEPLVDALIAPLMYSYAGDKERDTLASSGITPDQILPAGKLYGALAETGVRSSVFAGRDYTPSPFSEVVCRGAELLPYADLWEGLAAIAERTADRRQSSYCVLYFDRIDAAGHHHGPGSSQFAAEVDYCFRQLESTLHMALASRSQRTLLLLTADHGQTETDPRSTVYLNRTMPGIEGWIARNRAGRPLAPAGSSRDMFLHIRDECLGEAFDRLQAHLSDKAEVYLARDLIAQGFFGSAPPSEAFLGRVGNVVVLPYAGETVWWYEEGRFAHAFYGHHGGLTRQEMETELLALSYD